METKKLLEQIIQEIEANTQIVYDSIPVVTIKLVRLIILNKIADIEIAEAKQRIEEISLQILNDIENEKH